MLRPRAQLTRLGGLFVLPSRESLAIAHDKGQTFKVASEIGIAAPQTWEPQSESDFADQAMKLTPQTFIVKPRSGTGSSGLNYGENLSRSEWIGHWQKFGPMLIQTRVPSKGAGQGVSLLMDRQGKCVAAFAHERIHQYPNSGGPSTDRKSIHAPELVSESIRLLKHLQWRGIAMVEWKVDPRDGQARLMEINPRFWGSLELAVRSGVNFPFLYAQVAKGVELPAIPDPRVTGYRIGLRCRWFFPGEILRFLTQPRPERESIFTFFKGLPQLAEEWDWQDLRGAIATVICTAALALHPRYWKYLRRG